MLMTTMMMIVTVVINQEGDCYIITFRRACSYDSRRSALATEPYICVYRVRISCSPSWNA